MKEFQPGNVNDVELRAAYVEGAFRPSGVVYTIAENVIVEPTELSTVEVGNIILPPKKLGEANQARWELVDGAKDAIKSGATSAQEQVYATAELLDMRRAESISIVDVQRIDPNAAIWIAEGGANRTSVVRRELALDAMVAVWGNNLEGQILFQLGSGSRAIPRQKLNADKLLRDNPEYDIACEIAAEFLPATDDLTEFGLNLATAQQSGYQIRSDVSYGDAAARVVELYKEGMPALVLVQPHDMNGGLQDGFTAISKLVPVQNKQFVVSTNGQYRPKDELQAQQWAHARAEVMLPAVALGDEPGYSVSHAGKSITTAARPALVYVNEMVILDRLY